MGKLLGIKELCEFWQSIKGLFVKKTGDTMSGDLTVSASDTSERRVTVKNSLVDVELIANPYSNHGVYSRAVGSGQSSGWIIYKNASGHIIAAGIDLSSQTANKVLASPDGSDGAPTFRALVAADIPNLNASKITAGTLALARGGTASDNTARAAHTVFAGPESGSAGDASWRRLVAADIPTKEWVQLTSASTATTKSINLTYYKEVMIVATSGTNYMGSVIFPYDILPQNLSEVYLGGWGNNASTSKRKAYCKLSQTRFQVMSDSITIDGTSSVGSWLVYAR